jgi:tRNA(Arg) A34 adenosine deaminase TadA
MMSRETDERYMRLAIDKTREGMAAGQAPFGACLVRGGEILATTHNTVSRECDITCHAEIDAVRQACRDLGSMDLSGSVLYATATPCAMCFTSAEMAGVDRVVIGVGPEDFRTYFPATSRPPTFRIQPGTTENGIEIVLGVLRDECLALFKTWADR